MGLAKLSKKEKPSGYLKSITKDGGHLIPEKKRQLALKNGRFRVCFNCGCPKMQHRSGRLRKRNGFYCYNCGWLSGKG